MNVLWLQSGGCGGCSMSLLCADTADFPAMLEAGGIEMLGIPRSMESGRELITLLADCRAGRRRLDVLCVEGALLRRPNGTGRFHLLAGTGVPMIGWVREARRGGHARGGGGLRGLGRHHRHRAERHRSLRPAVRR